MGLEPKPFVYSKVEANAWESQVTTLCSTMKYVFINALWPKVEGVCVYVSICVTHILLHYVFN